MLRDIRQRSRSHGSHATNASRSRVRSARERPSITVDTGCSSSLIAFHLGNQSLLNNEADFSLVLGSALQFAPNTYQTMSDMGFISSDGRCHSFDAAGSGYVRGDGICAVVLKRKQDAWDRKDRIRALVRATAVNHDGRTDGITLPSSEAQEELIRSTYAKAGLDPIETSYFEVCCPLTA